ncbi:TolB-like 6-bladed beta-propeller domain-containing protein [Belliella sp. DSM 111904]|uniref:TolB-like 6-bladed beta-propeller domain-containing protein n=1 Tax=Belliella filtrata TaxID=2923435 RepID=A0ABS9V3R7_9BACT|nr:TolB-like 6-bladed beta-propeller domain-containing protein [Belliella filtrata]MCH7411056.1 TolB-like 6-bladed beta-propeller domain-containing protein [Belliella filtrata]
MKAFYYLLILLLTCCSLKDSVEKFDIISVETLDFSDKIKDFDTEETMTFPHLTIIGDFLFVTDLATSIGKGVHIYNKNTMNYITSTCELGEGPGEITRIGEIAKSYNNKEFWMPDFAKLQAFKFDIDSLLVNKDYKPRVSLPIKNDFFLTRFNVLSDSLAIGSVLEPLSSGTFRISLGKWNLKRNETKKIGYEHPKLEGKRTNAYFNYSHKHSLMALSYFNYDILSVFDKDGNLKYNITGKNELNEENRKLRFFGPVNITSNYIIASYSGNPAFKRDINQRPKGVEPSKLLFFSLNGKLEKILETGFGIISFTIDEDNKRIICSFSDRENQIGYFPYE